MRKYDKELYYYDKKKAERATRFIHSYCLHAEGSKAGKPFLLEKFQTELLAEALGWYHKENDRIKHRYVWFEVPKGNGKSGLLALLAIYKACAEGVQNGSIYVAAGDKNQARIVHDDCKNVIKASPKLIDKFTVLKDKIVHNKSGTFIEVLSAESETKHGFRPYCIIFDEIHVQPNRELYDTLTKGLMKTANSQCWVITTAGYPGTFYEVQHDYAEALVKGTLIDDTWLPIIYKANLPKDKKKAAAYIWTKKAWQEANPALGTIIDPFDFETLAKSAQNVPSERDAFKRLHLNIITAGAAAWDIVEHWHKCNKYPIDTTALEDAECYGGLDLASTRDLSSFVLKFPETGDILNYSWIPEDTALERTKGENINYLAWVEDGQINTTPGNVQDYETIKSDIMALHDQFNIVSIGYDRFNSSQLVVDLTAEGVNMTPFGQGFGSMSAPTKEVEKNIVGGKYNHAGNPVMTWQIGNVVLDENPAGDVKPNKKKSKEKIDSIVALIMAEGEHMTALAEGGGISEDYEFKII